MPVNIADQKALKKILTADYILGIVTGLAGIAFKGFFSRFFGIDQELIMLISVVTLMYGIGAFIIARPTTSKPIFVRWLCLANWFWTGISLMLLIFCASSATIWGILFLVVQLFVVGALAILEGRQLIGN